MNFKLNLKAHGKSIDTAELHQRLVVADGEDNHSLSVEKL